MDSIQDQYNEVIKDPILDILVISVRDVLRLYGLPSLASLRNYCVPIPQDITPGVHDNIDAKYGRELLFECDWDLDYL